MNAVKDEDVLCPAEALDIYNAETLQPRLAEFINSRLTPWLDLQGVSACDTAGAQLLWSAAKSAANDGKKLQFKNVPAVVQEACHRLGLPELF